MRRHGKISGPVFKPGFSLSSYQQIFFDVPKTVPNSFLDSLLMIPYMVPGTVLGIGFIVAFNKPPIYLTGTSVIIILTYFIRRLPYSVRSAASIVKQIDPALEEAGINVGSPPGRTFRTITLPLMQG